VKLGIRAPKSIPVARKELHVVGQQNQAASSTISPLSVIQLLERLKNPSSNPISGL
jgi:sRNA-binding carbon storage regulator CsrA